MEKSFTVYTDGGARGNPGPAAVGFVVKDAKGKILKREGKYIGETTNNIAEYRAVMEALKWIADQSTISHQESAVNFFLDSKLIVNQLNGLFKVKNHGLRRLIVEVRGLEQRMGGNVTYRFIPREKNRQADALVNQVLDQNIL